MHAGEFKIPIKIKRFKTVVDEFGFSSEEWVTIGQPRAKVEFDERLAREVFRDDMVNTTIAKIFNIRKPRGYTVTIKDCITYEGNRYEIYGINDVGSSVIKIWARAILNNV